MGGGTYARHFKCAVSFGMEETGEPAPEWVGPMHGPDEGVSEALLFKALKIYILAIAALCSWNFDRSAAGRRKNTTEKAARPHWGRAAFAVCPFAFSAPGWQPLPTPAP